MHTSKLITHILKKFEKKINRKDLKEICGQIDERFRSGKPKPTGPHSKINLRKNIADDYNLACSTPSPLVKLTASPSLKRGARLNTRRGSTTSDRQSTTKQSFKISTSDHTTRQSYKISSPSSSPSPSPSFVKTTKQSFKISSSSEIPLPKHHHSFKVASVSSSDPQLNKKSSFKVSSKAAAIGSLDDMAGPFSSPVQKVKSTKLRKTLSESNATLKEPHQNNSKDAEGTLNRFRLIFMKVQPFIRIDELIKRRLIQLKSCHFRFSNRYSMITWYHFVNMGLEIIYFVYFSKNFIERLF